MFERIIGIDPAIKSKHTAAILDSSGNVIRRNYKFAPTKSDFDALLTAARLDGISFDKICIVCEPTSLVWMPIVSYFSSLGCTIFMIKPEKSAAIRKFYKKHAKTDAIDSLSLARMVFFDPDGLYPLSLRPADYVALERLCKQRDKLTSSISANKNRIKTIFQMANPSVSETFEDLLSAAGRKFLRNYVDPRKILSTGAEQLSLSLNNSSRGQTHLETINAIFACARNTLQLYATPLKNGTLPFNYEQLQLEVNIYLDTIESAEKNIALLNSEIQRLYHKIDPDECLKSLKGFDTYSAAIVTSITGNVNRFRNNRQYKAFSSVPPKIKSTSDTQSQGLSISKGSNPLLRKTLYMAAESARHWDVDFAKKYRECIVLKRMHHKQAICVLANMMASRVFSLLKNSHYYQLRDAAGSPVDKKAARNIILSDFKVTKKDRQATSNHRKRGKGTLHLDSIYPRQSLNSSLSNRASSSPTLN